MNDEWRRKRVQRTDNREKIKSVNREAVMLEQSEPTVDADVYQQKSRKFALPAFCLIILNIYIKLQHQQFPSNLSVSSTMRILKDPER